MSLEGKSPAEIEALAALADSVLSKPDTAGVFQRLVKKNNPQVSMPIVELEDRTVAALQSRDTEIANLKKSAEQNEAERQVNAMYESLRDAGVCTTRASFSELVKWASENGFMGTETGLRKAAMQRESENQAAEPTPSTAQPSGFSLGLTGDELGKSFMKDPTGTARTQAMKAMDELRSARNKGTRPH